MKYQNSWKNILVESTLTAEYVIVIYSLDQ